MELAKSFDPAAIESRWYAEWERRGYFAAGLDAGKPAFCIQLPPPNVTGVLHMGHAFNQTIMDALTRYHRMRGFNTLWLPGTDHAGIATQIVVERQLEAQGTSREELGREEFVEQVWAMEGAVRLDDHRADAPARRLVRLVARVLHDGREALARGHRDLRAALRAGPHLPRQAARELGPGARSPPSPTSRSRAKRRTAASGTSAIRFAGGPIGGLRGLTVATTRPETMLGDVAVAVNPEDERYRHLVGKRVVLPLADRDDPGDRRRVRRQGVRHRVPEDHAGARLQRLPGRTAARPAADRGPHARREDQRERAGEVSRARPLRRAQARRRGPRRRSGCSSRSSRTG